MLDRVLLFRLLIVKTQKELAHEFRISVPTLRKYVRGREPREAIAIYMNNRMKELMP